MVSSIGMRPRKVGFSVDSPLEGDGFELSVPGVRPSNRHGRRDCCLENGSGKPKVRIHLPPSESLPRTPRQHINAPRRDHIDPAPRRPKQQSGL
jgi:hypothetical protein